MRTRFASTAGERDAIAGRMRRQADIAEQHHPTMAVHGHLRDAARQLQRGNTEGAQRHLRVAIQSLTPLQLTRHGHLTDDEHGNGKQHMALITRHLMQIKDVEDTEDHNAALRSARQAMNAPVNTPAGQPDRSVAGGPQPPAPTRTFPPARNWQQAASASAGPGLVAASNNGQRTLNMGLGAWIHERRDPHGEWTSGDGAGKYAQEQKDRQFYDAGYGHAFHPMNPDVRVRVNAEDIKRTSRNSFGDEERHIGTNYIQANENEQIGTVRSEGGKYKGKFSAELNHPNGWDTDNLGMFDNYDKAFQAVVDRHNSTAVPASYNEYVRGLESAAGIESVNFSMTDMLGAYKIAIELSAKTPALASTPHPFGKPGGPGLWNVKGMELPPYVQNIAHALLRTGRAKTLSQAIAIARAATKKWMRGGGHVYPEVRAASAGADAQWRASQAVAHSHSNTGQRELLLFNPNHGPGGQFTTPQNTQQGKGKQQSAGKHHGAIQRAREKGRLLEQARIDQDKAANLRAQIHALLASLRSGHTSGRTAASSSSTKAAGSATKAAPAGKAGAPRSSSSTPRKPSASRAQVMARVAQLRSQIHSLEASARQATAQAAHL